MQQGDLTAGPCEPKVRAMSQTQSLAWRNLSDRLRATLPEERRKAFVGGTHTAAFPDNVVKTVTPEQLRVLQAQLARANGGELRPNKNGKCKAHAPYSSAALALNAFGGWLGRERMLSVAGHGGWTEPLGLEAKRKIDHRGGTVNFDVLLEAGDRVVGIESKLTEFIPLHRPAEWKAVYRSPQMADLLDKGWRSTLKASLDGTWQPEHLGVEQLLKNALALRSAFAHGRLTLLYCFWEPTNRAAFPEFKEHRQEIEQLVFRVGANADPTFVALSYTELFREWEAGATDGWVREHLAALRARYEFAM